jgi:hypothetical protein
MGEISGMTKSRNVKKLPNDTVEAAFFVSKSK